MNIEQIKQIKTVTDLSITRECKLKLKYNDNGESKEIIFPYDWYFYIKKQDWIKVNVKYIERKNIVNEYKQKNIQTYEADLSLVRRFWIDSDCHIAEPEDFKLLYCDIEVDDTVSGLRIGQDKIISFAAIDDTGKIYQYLDIDERTLLIKITKLLTEHDIIIGWNSRNYDIPYLQERCKKYYIEFPDICHIDMMQRMIHAYRFDTQIKSFSLNNIAQQFLGKQKIQRTTKIIDIYKNDFETFKKYNLTDVELLKELNDKYHIILMILKQAYWCNVTPRSMGQGGHGMYTLIDTMILRKAHLKNIKCLTPKYTFDELNAMSKEEQQKLDYPGGLVLDPKPGYYENAYTFDFATMYPSIILTSNIGFETLNVRGDIRNPSGSNFVSSPRSVLCEVLDELLMKRKEYKLKKLELIEQGKKKTPEYESMEANEAVVKELGNSVYGIMGAKWGRYFSNRGIVESITLMGQYLLKSLQTFFIEKGYNVIMGDTDSCVISTTKDFEINKTLDEYHEYIKNKLLIDCNIKNSKIKLAFDRYFKTFILVAKKNYAGWLINQEGRSVDYIHIRGLEVIKSDTCKLSSLLLHELIDLLLKEKYNEEFYDNWLKEKRKTVFKNIDVSQLLIHKKVKKLEDYKTSTLASNIVKRKLQKGEILVQHEIDYIVTGRQNNKLTGVEISDYQGIFDKEYYWNNMIIPQCSRLLNVVFSRTKWDSKTYYNINQLRLI